MARIKSESLIASYRDMPCLVSNNDCVGDTCAHHIKTKGAGGDDKDSNLMPLCYCHHSVIHVLGLKRFSEKYNLSNWLISKGWYYCKLQNKWKLDD